MLVNTDLHIHGRFSGGVSKNMNLKATAEGAKQKGIDLMATGDALHPTWLKEIKEMERIDEGTLALGGVRFVLTTEVEDIRRVHHLLIFPSISAVEDFRERTILRSSNMDRDGRAKILMSGEEIAEAARDVDALIGPCHAFTPWTAMYAYHDSLKECYGDHTDYISFVELGLSADSDYADRIEELRRLTFLTNSDAHSQYPDKLAREFNRFEMDDATFSSLRDAILRKKGRAVLNVGLPPEEGKYNETACTRCFTHYSLQEAKTRKWKCTCGGRIKKGVKDRVNELATYDEPKHPEYRPPYLHLIPLGEIIRLALGHGSTHTKGVQTRWESLVNRFGSEVAVLVDTPIDDLEGVGDAEVVGAIRAFREGKITVIPGGGGEYGRVVFGSDADTQKREKKEGQRSLFDY